MARFYGKLQGARGPTSRLGHANSGLETEALSYQGCVRVYLYAVGDADYARITASEHGRGGALPLYDGPVAALLDGKTLVQRAAEQALAKRFGGGE